MKWWWTNQKEKPCATRSRIWTNMWQRECRFFQGLPKPSRCNSSTAGFPPSGEQRWPEGIDASPPLPDGGVKCLNDPRNYVFKSSLPVEICTCQQARLRAMHHIPMRNVPSIQFTLPRFRTPGPFNRGGQPAQPEHGPVLQGAHRPQEEP